MTEEVATLSATGGAKNQKLGRLGSIDPRALLALAEVAGFGEKKYARLNFLNGYDWSLSYDALQRHLLAFWSGQENDDHLESCLEDCDLHSGMSHLIHASWHCMALFAFVEYELGTDDRYVKPEKTAATSPVTLADVRHKLTAS